MKKLFLLILVLNSINISYSQLGNSPYPIIFVHGFDSYDLTWATTYNYLSNSFSTSSNNKFHAVLNARGNNTTEYFLDVLTPTHDTNGNLVNRLTNSNIYLVNFQNFWNEDGLDPRIILYGEGTPGTNQSPSNRSSIFKQGYALKKCIDSVLSATGSNKVILVGHSMGGLTIREYLQRLNEFDKHSWWVDSLDEINGHHVAKVVTIGTPHLGTNFLFSIPASEAARDFRYSYSGDIIAPYLFGNNEVNIPGSYDNKDVNCDGDEVDLIEGINRNVTDYNEDLPLPLNIEYTWITSNSTGSGDGVVDLSKQWLYDGYGNPSPVGTTDTLLTNRNHLQETSDYKSIIRGLDEPDNMTFAYPIKLDISYSGFITTPSESGSSLDSDYYKVTVPENGILTATIIGSNAGLTGLAVLSNTGNVIVTTSIMSSTEVISCSVNSGEYFIRVRGFGNQNPDFNSYRLKANFVPSILNNGLIAYYPFENDANDYSGHNNHGSFQNSAHITTGIIGNGVQITENGFVNGNGGHVLLPYSLINTLNNLNSFSISLWAKEEYMNSYGGEAYIWFGDDHGTNGCAGIGHFVNFADNSQNIDFFSGAPNNFPRIRYPVINLNLNNFNHYTLTYENGNLKAFVNGNLVNTTYELLNIFGTNAAIGKHWWNSGAEWSTRLQGVIDDVRIYDRSLSPSEIQQLYSLPNIDSGLIAYYPFNGNTNDESGNNQHGTNNGATLTQDVFGNLNNAYNFNGIDTYINIPDLNFSNLENISWHTMIYPERSINEIIVYYGYFGQIGIFLSNNKVVGGISLSDQNWYIAETESDIVLERWYSVTCMWEKGNYLKLYVNGELRGQISLPDLPIGPRPPNHSSLGAYNRFIDNPRPYKGKIDEVRIYSRELSQSEILSLYNSSSSSFEINFGIGIQGFKNSIGNNLRDTITIQFRNSISPYSIVDSLKGILDSVTSNVNSNFNSNYIQNGNPYYIVIKHRNSIETWSALPQNFSSYSLNYDFKYSSLQAFGNNLIQAENTWCIFSGDVNQDGIIDASDLSAVENDAGISLSGYVNTDVTGDYYVDASDLSIVENNSSQGVIAITP